MNSQKIVELNGKHYDVVSGSLLSSSAAGLQATAATKVPIRVQPTLKKPVMDVVGKPNQLTGNATTGTLQPTRASSPAPHVAAPRIAHTSTTGISKTANHAHTAAAHYVAHKQQPASTLMRRAVSKPAPGFKKQINVQSTLQTSVPSLIVKKTSVNNVTPDRLLRSQAVNRNEHIARFEQPKTHSLPAAVAPIRVLPEPHGPSG